MTESANCDPLTVHTKVQHALQMVENVLLQAGYDGIMVTTERGSFQWRTAEPAREADFADGNSTAARVSQPTERWLPGDFPGAVERDAVEPEPSRQV